MIDHEFSDMFIKQDIQKLNQRISDAKKKLNELPASASTWKDRKKLNARRHNLKSEIQHVKNLIEIAESSLEAT